MKKIRLILLISFMTTILLLNTSFASTKGTVNSSAVRIREKASVDSPIVTNAYNEDEVEILSQEGEWYKVKFEGKEGYAKSEFFNVTGEVAKTPEVTETPVTSEVPETSAPTENIAQPIEEPVVETESKPVENTNNSVTENESRTFSVGENVTILSDISIRNVPNMFSMQNKISANSLITIEAVIGNWCKISDGTNLGWITHKKLSKSLSESVPEITENEAPTAPAETKPEEVTEVNTPTENTAETNEPTPLSESNVNKTAIVIVETARVREKPSSNGEIIGSLDEDQIITITGEEGDFYKFTSNTESGYVSKSLVKIRNTTSRSMQDPRTGEIIEVKDEVEPEPENTINESANDALNQALMQPAPQVSSKGEEIITFAKQYLGYAYVYGGSSPSSGFDCSGFTRYVFGHFGYSLNQVAASQASNGVEVSRDSLQAGDLLLFYDDAKTKIGHVGIYIGNGDFIHSANPKRGVVIDNINTSSYYNPRYVGARRIAN